MSQRKACYLINDVNQNGCLSWRKQKLGRRYGAQSWIQRVNALCALRLCSEPVLERQITFSVVILKEKFSSVTGESDQMLITNLPVTAENCEDILVGHFRPSD